MDPSNGVPRDAGIRGPGDVQGDASPESPGSSPAWETSFSPGAFFRTFPEVLFYPGATFRTMTPRAALGAAILFVLIALSVPMLFNSLTFPSRVEAMIEKLDQTPGGAEYTDLIRRFGLTEVSRSMVFVGGLLGSFASLLIQAGILHLCLILFGSAKQTFESTLRVFAYSLGATAPIAMIPCVGGLVALTWQYICIIIGLSEQNGISRGRATAIATVPGLVMIFCCCGLGAVLWVLFLRGGLSG